MSANVIVRQPDGIVIATDGIAYDVQGNVVAYVSKVVLMPEWSCAFTHRGAGVASMMIHQMLARMAEFGVHIRGFDDVLTLLPAAAEQVHKTLLADPRPGYRHFSLVAAGYSTERERFETHSVRSRDYENVCGDEIVKQPAYTLSPLPRIVFAPAPSDEAMAAAGLYLRGPNDPPEAAHETAIRGVCAARLDKGSLPGEVVDEDYSIGGFIQVTTILRDSIRSEIVHRWPDPIGEPVDPTRGDLLPDFLRG